MAIPKSSLKERNGVYYLHYFEHGVRKRGISRDSNYFLWASSSSSPRKKTRTGTQGLDQRRGHDSHRPASSLRTTASSLTYSYASSSLASVVM